MVHTAQLVNYNTNINQLYNNKNIIIITIYNLLLYKKSKIRYFVYMINNKYIKNIDFA